ncbi:cysteinyl-tRNA synthetase [Deinococcus proteolyticus MRP]|uniref:Cysteine--tRNA ligase n=1 Tax=Deinococcus proteolyticus (strain ATCC 35074 / DSM 20540 / JCM 6276 / NBRC 101906 / NCIMB 13154 / VKM Ac-1939 / CCM 2703 / MRP) TaxID=693977 RepID=F0RNH4_DEIPM|nr:cysteine--tRNA ligase [Deinococcus proteolyticus]ADY26300.1 cysteinyl-tRNA synthetase [Deinococcus proteolyticus MRP]
MPDVKTPDLNIHLYDTMQRQKVRFEPSTPGHVGMYLCGPTVYSDAHLGHAKKEVAFDVIRRTFLHFGYKVRYVANITDVGHLQNDSDDGEDKMLARARLEQLEPMEVADKYFWSFFKDMDALNVLRPSINPRATGHIQEQIKLIEELIEKGHAYESNGSVYFDVRSWPEYGKLSGRKLDDQEEGTREAVREEKRDPRDFALWKNAEPEHIMRWDSPWGVGFPGWHIECSAMSLKYLGEGFDIHGGGLDLQFPHHEAEIAQAEAAGHHFARYWMHNNMLTIGGEKMSKSKGNFTTIQDILQRYDPMVVRFLLVSSHYRSVTEMNDEAFASAANGYRRLVDTLAEIERRLNDAPAGADAALDAKIAARVQEFEDAMRDDFNTPKAVAALYGLTTEMNTALNAGAVGRETLEQARNAYRTLGGDVLGLFAGNGQAATQDDAPVVDRLMEIVLKARQNYRLQKQYAEADELRDTLGAVGITVEDTKDGARWKR